MHTFDIIRRPIVTEKTTAMQEQGRYVFEVANQANKRQVKEAVQAAFSVEVVQINTLNVKGKKKRLGPSSVQKRSWKKAIVTLASGQSITIFEGV